LDDTPVVAGSVMIGDQPIGATTRDSVRYVGQNPTLFRGTILENLTLFGDIPAGAALEASRLIGLDDEVVRMPLGYDTMLKNASGRDVPAPTAQRLCLARALTSKPSVLVLDEANTVLDLAGEQKLAHALRLLRGKVTILLATHRPSLIALADEAYEIAGKTIRRVNNDRATAVRA
jgi:ABC-type multidrug transport system fused ATPase/permease subunit